MTKIKWTEIDDNQLLAAIRDGKTAAEFAAHSGRTVRSVTSRIWALRKKGVEVPKAAEVAATTKAENPELLAYWQSECRKLQSEITKLEHKNLGVEVLIDEARSLAPIGYQPPAPVIERKKRSVGSPQSAVLLFSDTHVGKVITPDQTLGFGNYNFDIFRRMVKRLEQSIFSILEDHTTTEVPEIVVAMIGDMIDGKLIHSVEAGQVNTVFEQFYSAGHVIAQFLNNISSLAPLRIYTAVGNHCVDSETELLTNNGWKKVSCIDTKSDLCLGMTPDGKGVWQPFTLVEEKQVDRMVHITNRQFNFRGTEHHRFYFQPQFTHLPPVIDRVFEARWSEISKFVSQHEIRIPAAVPEVSVGLSAESVPDNLIELCAAVLTDGYVSKEKNRVVVYQNPKKEAWVRATFEKSGFTFSRRFRVRSAPKAICGRECKGGTTAEEVSYALSAKDSRTFIQQTNLEKGKLPGWAWNLTPGQFDRFLRTLLLGDGTKIDTDSPVLYGKSKDWLGQIQALCLCNGWRASLSEYRPNNNNPSRQYRLNLCKTGFISVGSRANVTYSDPSGEFVWCVRTATENFFCRRGGKAYLTGNTRWDSQRKMPTNNRFSNLDQFLYAYVQALLAGNPRVQFSLDKQPYAIFDVQGYRIFAGHGDNLRGGDRILGIPAHSIGRCVANNSQRFMVKDGRAPNLYCFGHLHRGIAIPHALGEVLINGGFVGDDGFGIHEAFTHAAAMQRFFLMHPKFGQAAEYKLRLDYYEKDGPAPYDVPPQFTCV